MRARILYIEDSEVVADVTIPGLRTLGEVRHVTDLRQAQPLLEWASHVVTDWTLARGDAHYVVICAMARALPVVVYTAGGSPGLSAKIGCPVLAKPATPVAVARALGMVVTS